MWRRLTTAGMRPGRTRYRRALEAEVARLRAENRALLNSILGIAGVPPIPVTFPEAESAIEEGSVNEKDAALAENARMRRPQNRVANREREGPAAPMRRRSWQQINRMLEFESTKKKKETQPEGKRDASLRSA